MLRHNSPEHRRSGFLQRPAISVIRGARHRNKAFRNKAWMQKRMAARHVDRASKTTCSFAATAAIAADAPLPRPGLCLFRALAARFRTHRSIEIEAAAASPGIVGVLTAGIWRRRQPRPPPAARRTRRQGTDHAASARARRRTGDAYRRAGGDGRRREPRPRRRTPPNLSPSIMSRSRRLSMRARRSRPARHKSGRRPRAISRSTGRGLPPIRTPMRARSTRFSPARNLSRASR